MPELTVEGLDKVIESMTIKLPSVLRRMAFNVDANVAAEGRLKEQQTNTSRGGSAGKGQKIRMGLRQRKGFFSIPKVRSKWDPKVGWVSTSRSAAKGGTGFRMASFGWERAKKGSVTAPYSSQIANLWHRETNAYKGRSPLVGTPGHYGRWQRGERRDARYDWSSVYHILASMAPKAVARTEAKFAKELESL